MNQVLKRTLNIGGRIIVVASLVLAGLPHTAHAAVTNPAPAAHVSFTFDDSLQSAYTNAEPILAKYGLTGTDYVITNCVGMTTTPNTCNANQSTPYMTWSQVQSLQNTDGWEIGSHTVDHDCLASSAQTDPSDCANPAPLTTAQIDTELSSSKSTLAANGINATDFAPPYGDYNNNVIAQIAKYYATMRQFKNAANNANVWPYSDYYLQDFTVLESTDPVSSVEAAINNAITNNQWLVLTFHDIEPTPSSNPDNYQYGTAELSQIAAYVQSKESAGLIQPEHVSQGLVTSNTNLLPNGNFSSGISGGWTTDNSADVVADTGSNGSYPNSTYAVKVSTPSSGANVHLFSPKVAVDPNTTYMFKNFLNTQSITSGAVAYYVDEYDANGNWISGQYLKQETSPFVEDMNFSYKPSSPNVSKASLQVIANGDGINAYLANSQMFALSTTSPTNLVPNGTFDAGISGGWTTDAPATIIADSANHGSPNNPVNSVAMTKTSANTHLFSPHVVVSSTHSYSMTSYLNLTALNSGEIGYYIDEYNSSGTWISGKYITGVHTIGAGDVGFTYTPSSASVASASLQIIVVGNSGAHAYFDDVRWYQN
jgi:peptidoglycan/xylan/chitin deacetylase (PgdA/CDA1 family)